MSKSKGAQTRQHIIVRAADVFNTRGFFGTSLADLTQATGLERGGIYNHFASKETLAIAAFDYAVDLMRQRLDDALQGKERSVDRLVAIASVLRSVIEQPPLSGGCPILNTAIESDDTSPTLRERARNAMTGWHKLIGSTVKAGVERGELRPDTNPYDVATVLTATLEGAIMLSKLYDDPTYMQRAADHAITYLHALEQ